MLKILIVDDDENKRRRIADAVNDAVGVGGSISAVAESATEALHHCEQSHYDILILDLNLPIRPGEPPVSDAGMNVMRRIVRGGSRFKRPSQIIGLTAYDELAAHHREEFSLEGWLLVRYDASSSDWATSVRNKVVYADEVGRQVHGGRFSVDLCIITALKSIELDAVLKLDAGWIVVRISNDDTIYHKGVFRRGSLEVRVIAAAAHEMGMSAAASLTMKMIYEFRPKYLVMAGIAAGVGVNFGDIIVADQAWDYGSGKVREKKGESQFAPAPNQIPVHVSIKEGAEYFASRTDVLARIQASWGGNPAETVLKVRVGPVASGSAVVESKQVVESIKSHNRKLVGIEMETYGVFLAAKVASSPQPIAFSAKSCCDFGVPPKTDEYQRYAAFTSAAFVYEFSLEHIFAAR